MKATLLFAFLVAVKSCSASPLNKASNALLLPTFDPKELVTRLNDELASYYNAKNFDAIANNLYFDGAMFIPSNQATFLTQAFVASFYQGLSQSGHDNAVITPIIVVQASDNLIHEIGNWTDSTGKPAQFYVRWLRSSEDPSVWKVAFQISTLGGLPSSSEHVAPKPSALQSTDPSPADIINARNARFVQLYNSQDFQGLTDEFYAPGSYMITFTSDALIPQTGLTAYWQNVYASGVRNLTVASTLLVKENDALIHEIGYAGFTGGAGYYYSRWSLDDTAALWRYSFDVGTLQVAS